MKDAHKICLLTLLLAACLPALTQSDFCGVYAHTPPPPPTHLTDTSIRIFDHFGNEYSHGEIEAVPQFGNDDCIAGLFWLTFEDAGTGIGFDEQPVLGTIRRQALCQVFTDLSLLLDYPVPPNANLVRVHIRTSNVSQNPNSNALATASPYYAIPNGLTSGVVQGEVFKTIVGQQNSYAGLPMNGASGNVFNGFHGFMQFVFSGQPYYYDLSTTQGAGELDFYTICLHEALHLLGISAAIDANGASTVISGTPTSLYTRFSTLLDNNGLNLVDVTNLNSIPPVANNLLTVGCNTPPFPNRCTGGINPFNEIVYTPSVFSAGSSLSHFTCPDEPLMPCPVLPLNDFVMKHYICPGPAFANRHPNDLEYQVLCELGYQLTSTYGDPSSPNIWGTTLFYPTPLDNNYPGCSPNACNPFGQHDIVYVPNGGGIIAIEPALNDQPTGVNVTNLTHLTTSFNSGTAQLGNTIQYTPPTGQWGWDIYTYYPECNGQLGVLTYILLWNGDIQAACPPVACGENLVCMGDFEAITDNLCMPLSNFDVTAIPNSPGLFSASTTTAPSCGLTTPMPNPINMSPNGSHYALLSSLGMSSNEESLSFPLTNPVFQGDALTLSFWEHINHNFNPVQNGCVVEWEFYLSENPPCPPTTGTVFWTTGCPAFNPQALTLGAYPAARVNAWVHQNAFNLTAPPGGPYNWLIVTGGDNQSVGFIDDIRLTRTGQFSLNVSASPANTLWCANQNPQVVTFSIQNPNAFPVNTSFLAFLSPFMAVSNGMNFALNGQQWLSAPQTIPAGQTVQLSIELSIPNPNTAPVNTPISVVLSEQNGACLTGTIQASFTQTNNSLNLEKVWLNNNGIPAQGDVLDFLITVSQAGNSNLPVQNIQMHDLIPPAFDLSSFTPAAGNGLTASLNGNDLVFDPFDLIPGGLPLTFAYSIELAHSCLGEAQNCVEINAADNLCVLPPPSCVHFAYTPTPTAAILSGGVLSGYTATGIDVHITADISIQNGAVLFDNCNLIMYPGVKISVDDFGKLQIHDSHMYGCTQMWDRIEVFGKAAYLAIKNSTVEDAQYAVHARNKVAVTLGDVHFRNNIIGLYVPHSPGLTHYVDIVLGGLLQFDSDGNFKDNFPGQPLPHGDRGLAGMMLFQNGLPLDFGAGGGCVSHFERLSCGVSVHNTDANIERATFRDIDNDPVYAISGSLPGIGIDYMAVAVNAYCSKLSTHSLSVQGLGDAATDPYTFEDCGYGVVAKRVRSDIRLCRMNTFQGIHVHNVSASNHATIAHNRIEARHTGISLSYNDAAQFVRVHDNDILMNAPAALLGNRTGIDVQYTKFADCRLHLYCNRITLLTSGWGIRLNSARAAAGQGNIHHNDISFDPNPNGLTAGNPAGLLLLNTDNFRLSENDISGSGGAQVAQNPLPPANGTNQHGISLWAASDNRVECNRLDQTAVGVGFTMLCAGTQLRGNDIGSHSLGLAYSSTAATGDQIDAGNSWNGSYAYLGAENLNAVGFPGSRFYIDFNIPTTSSFYPPSVSPPFNWFVPNLIPQPTYLCSPTDDCSVTDDGQAAGIDEPYEYRVARDSSLSYEHGEEMLWLAQQRLFEWMRRDDSLSVDTVLQAFYQTKINETLGTLALIRVGMDSLELLDTQDSLQLHGLDSLRLFYIGELHADSIHTDSLLWLLTYTDSLIGVVLADIQERQGQLRELLMSQNEAVQFTETYQENEVRINRILLDLAERPDEKLNPEQIAVVEGIAGQCPLTGGSAVFVARSLYKALMPFSEYDDYGLCMQQGLQMRAAAQDKENYLEFYVYPNPSTGILNIVFPLGFKGDIRLMDNLGNSLKEDRLETETHELAWDLRGLATGVYYVRAGAAFQKIIIQ